MGNEEQGTLMALDPDAPAGRSVPARMPRLPTARGTSHGRTGDELPVSLAAPVAEATLNLEPLRLPITTMVQGTLRAEREVLEQLSTDLRTELALLHEWHTREEALRGDQTDLYLQAAEHWHAAGEHAVALRANLDRLEGITAALHGAIEAAIARFWRRALLAAWLVALTGVFLLGGLCGVVWLALMHR
jgi:hypothetical protein